MKTFRIDIAVNGTITIPDTVVAKLRLDASDPPETGGDKFMHETHLKHEADDDFVQALLKNALRNIVRVGLTTDIPALGEGVGFKLAPAQVEVSVPQRVVTAIAGKAQVPYDGEPFPEGVRPELALAASVAP